ncbi:MAG: hypothetical protein LBR54_02990 [Oscillospiraceae bacterium]|nr:hypothetical protein [Oscillospiraceae bacterium]
MPKDIEQALRKLQIYSGNIAVRNGCTVSGKAETRTQMRAPMRNSLSPFRVEITVETAVQSAAKPHVSLFAD